jgi:hypothetical protein
VRERSGAPSEGRSIAFPASIATPAALGQAQSTPTPAFGSLHEFLKGNSEAVREAVRCFSLFT